VEVIETPLRPVASIKLVNRYRVNLGDIPAFAADIADKGLLQPICILPDGTLIGGERRIRAFQHNEAAGVPTPEEEYRGWTEIPVHVVNLDDLLGGQRSENEFREPFSPREIHNLTRAYKAELERRAQERRGTRTDIVANCHEDAGKTRDKLAALAAQCGSRSFGKGEKVFEAAESYPELYGDIADELERTGNYDAAYVRLVAAQKRNLPKNRPALPEGKFETVVIDPPWDIKRIDLVVAPSPEELDYDTMTDEQIEGFFRDYVLPSLADDAHTFTWTIQSRLQFTINLMERVGLTYVLTMVWHKTTGMQPLNLPKYNCEFVVYARKGSPRFVDTKDFPCCFHGESREHSRKPDEFYDRMRRVTAGPRIDIFSREPREGFVQFGDEVKRFIEQPPLKELTLEDLGL
jgi:N6-adenosine-specific RNA methylase IME4